MPFGEVWGLSVPTILLARGATWAWALFAGAILLRLVMALVNGVSVLQDSNVVRTLWLLPIRDILAVIVWIGGLVGKKIVWRGEEFHLDRGKLKRMK